MIAKLRSAVVSFLAGRRFVRREREAIGQEASAGDPLEGASCRGAANFLRQNQQAAPRAHLVVTWSSGRQPVNYHATLSRMAVVDRGGPRSLCA